MSRRDSRPCQRQPIWDNVDFDAETLAAVRAHLDALARRCEIKEARLLEAWDRFYAACDPLIRRLARRRSGRCSDIDDRVQEIWHRIVGHFLHYDPGRGPFPNWLSVFIRNVLTDQDRAHHPCRHLDPESEQRLLGREPDPATTYELAQERIRIFTAIEELASAISETNYRIVHDHWIEGKSFGEIASTVGLSMKQVRDRHHRMMNSFREYLAKHG